MPTAQRRKKDVHAQNWEEFFLFREDCCSQQRLHSEFESALQVGEKKDGQEGAETENQTAAYPAMVSADTKMRISVCEGSHRSVRTVSQSWVWELGLMIVLRLVKMRPHSFILFDRDISHAGAFLV